MCQPRRAMYLSLASVLLVAALAAPTAAQSAASAGWMGVKVMPKLDEQVRLDNRVLDTKDWSIPYVVQDVNGQWLWVGAHEKGWVLRSQMLTLDEAPAYYTSLIRSGKQLAWAYNHRAITWKEKGDLDLAIADYGEELRLEPNAIAYNNRGNAWRDKKEYDKAIDDYNQAIRLDPNYKFAFHNRGATWWDKNEADKAIADYNQAIRLDPNYATAYAGRGVAWKGKKEYDKAIADYSQAIRLDSNNAFAYNCRGNVWSLKKEYDKAIADYSQAIRLDSNNAFAYNCRGNVWSLKKEYDKAIADFGQAIRLDPNDAFAYRKRSYAWSEKKDYANAIADYARTSQYDPNNADMYNASAWLRATCPDATYRDGALAGTNATKACELTGWTSANNIDTLAAAYAEAGDFDAALKWQQKAIDLNPTDAEFVKGAQERLALYRDKKPYRE